MCAAAIMSPIVPNKRQRSEHSPPPGWRMDPQGPFRDVRWQPSGHNGIPRDSLWHANDTRAPFLHTPDHQPASSHSEESWRLHQSESAPSSEPHAPPRNLLPKSCTTCTKAASVAPRIASGLDELHTELSKLSVSSPPSKLQDSSDASPPTRGLLKCLDWSLERLSESVKVTREVIAKSHKDSQASTFWRTGKSPNSASFTDSRWSRSRLSPQTDEGVRRHPELPPLFTEDFKRSSAFDPNSAAAGSSPPSSSMQSQTGVGSESGRPRYPTLPSPASLSVSSSILLPLMSPSIQGGGAKSPHAAHLEDLQHQLSTKILAHQLLSGEHEKLLSAYSRLQIRCATLDKKSAVSDSEIADLAEDRIRLQADLDAAEARIDELQAAQEESHKQQALNGDQYLRIMNMSSQLQAKGAEDMKKWKEEREALMAQRDALLDRVKQLEGADEKTLRSASDVTQVGSLATASDASPLPSSPEKLEKEVLTLRRRLREEEDRVRVSREEGCKLNALLKELGGISKRLTGGDSCRRTVE